MSIERPSAPRADGEAPKRRKSSYHHHDLRNAVLAEAIDLVVQRNGPHFSLREVASALGVTHSSVYRHFTDKSALLDALTTEGFQVLRRYQIEEAARHGDDALGQLQSMCVAYVRFAREQLGFFRLLFENRPETEARGRGAFNVEAYEALIVAIRRCQDEGILIDGDPERFAGYLVLAPHGLAHYLSQPDAPGLSPKGPIWLMSAEELNAVAIVPLLRERPAPEVIARLFAPR